MTLWRSILEWLFNPLPRPTEEPFEYCFMCSERFTSSRYWPYCSADCARSAELESTD